MVPVDSQDKHEKCYQRSVITEIMEVRKAMNDGV